jgi:hypothetical protein
VFVRPAVVGVRFRKERFPSRADFHLPKTLAPWFEIVRHSNLRSHSPGKAGLPHLAAGGSRNRKRQVAQINRVFDAGLFLLPVEEVLNRLKMGLLSNRACAWIPASSTAYAKLDPTICQVPWVSFVAEVPAVGSLLIVVTPGRSQCADAAGAVPTARAALVRFTGVLRDVIGKHSLGRSGSHCHLQRLQWRRRCRDSECAA